LKKAEEEFYQHLGLIDWLGSKDVIMPRVEAFCQFKKKPAKFSGLLEIELTADELKKP